jgi:phosphoribosylanthranilate isomerase
MVQVKICGIKKAEDANWAVSLGADMVGFNFYKESPRYVSVSLAKRVIATLPSFVSSVGIFVDEQAQEIKASVKKCKLGIVQLHGSETPEFCRDLRAALADLGSIKLIKTFHILDESSLSAIPFYVNPEKLIDYILLDTFKEGQPGGTGEVFNWELAIKARQYGPVILSGGLNPQNVEKAIEIVNPYGVDVASGVEAEDMGVGRKDYNKMKEFITKAKTFL